MHGGVVTVLLRFVFLRKLAKLSWRTMSQKTKRKIWTWIKTPRNLVGVITLSVFMIPLNLFKFQNAPVNSHWSFR